MHDVEHDGVLGVLFGKLIMAALEQRCRYEAVNRGEFDDWPYTGMKQMAWEKLHGRCIRMLLILHDGWLDGREL